MALATAAAAGIDTGARVRPRAAGRAGASVDCVPHSRRTAPVRML